MVYWPQNKVSPSHPFTTNHPPLPLPHPGFPLPPLSSANLEDPHYDARNRFTPAFPRRMHLFLTHSLAVPIPHPYEPISLEFSLQPPIKLQKRKETEIDRARAAEHRRTSAGSVGGERQLHNCHISDPLVSGQLPPRRVSVYNGPVRVESDAGTFAARTTPSGGRRREIRLVTRRGKSAPHKQDEGYRCGEEDSRCRR